MAEPFSMTVFLSFYNLFYVFLDFFIQVHIYLSFQLSILQTAHLWANTGVVERGVESISKTDSLPFVIHPSTHPDSMCTL